MSKRRLILSCCLLGLLGIAATFYRGDIPASRLDAEYAAPPSQFLEIEGSRVHFRDQGSADAPALLLLHGTAASLHTWDGWTRALSESFRILRLDLQGYGLTGANPKRDYSIDRQVRVIEQFLNRRGVESTAVAGNSLGGLIAWRLALAAPERINRVVLVNAAGAPRSIDARPSQRTGFRILDLAGVPGLRRLLTRLTPRFIVRSALRQVYGDPSRLTEERVARYHRILLRQGNRQALIDAMAQAGRNRPAGPSPNDLSQPTLILWGAKDRWIPVEHARRFHAAISGSRTTIYQDLGHVPMEEAPERTAADVADFLSDDELDAPPPAPRHDQN